MDTPMTPAPGGGGPDAAPAAAPKAKIRPGRIWYLVALLVLLAGVAWLVVGLLSISSRVDSFARVAIPAGGQITLDHSGDYVIYYEGPGAQSGQIPDFRVRVTPASAGAAVQSLGPYNSSVTYSFGSHQGRAVLSMRVGHPGRFRVETPAGGNVPVGSGLAFGDSIVGGVAGTALPSVLLILAGIVALVVIFIIRIVKTSRARSARPAWSPPGAAPGAQPGPPQGAQSGQPPGTQPDQPPAWSPGAPPAADPDPPLRADPAPPPTAQPEPPPTAQPGPPASGAQPGPPPTADPGPPPDADPGPPPTAQPGLPASGAQP
jgi:hypothetical protein